MHSLFSIWFYTLALVYSILVIPLLFLAMLVCRPFIDARRAMRMLRQSIKVWGRGIVSVLPYPYIRVRYTDFAKDNERAPFAYICNHRSASDAFLMSLLKGEGVQVVNIWPFRIPVIGWFARFAGYLSVREMPFDDFRTRVGNLFASGVSIVAFPEGPRSRSRQIGPFHGALFRACLEFGPTLAPICIMGNQDKPRRGSYKLRPGIVRIHRLPGIPYEEYRHMSAFALKNHVRAIIEKHILQNEGEQP